MAAKDTEVTEKKTDDGADAAGAADAGAAASTVKLFVKQNGGSVKAFKKYIAPFSDPSALRELGSQPPCRSYRSLRCLSEWDEIAHALGQVQSKQEISAIHAANKPFKAAYIDLLTMARAAGARAKQAIEKALAHNGRLKRQQMDHEAASTQHAAAKKRKVAAESHINFFSVKHTIAEQMPVIPVSKDLATSEKPDFNKPTVLRFDHAVISEGELKLDIEAMRSKWAGGQERVSYGRAHRHLGEAADAALDKLMGVTADEFLPNDKVLNGPPQLSELKPAGFAIAADKLIYAFEASQLHTFRLTFEGTRELCCLPGHALMTFMAEQTADKAMPTVRGMASFLRSWTVEMAREFKEKDPATNLLYFATVGPQDCLSLPAGRCFAEKVSTVDTFGVRVQRLRSADLDTLEKLNVIFMGQKKPNEVLQAAVDLLTLAVG